LPACFPPQQHSAPPPDTHFPHLMHSGVVVEGILWWVCREAKRVWTKRGAVASARKRGGADGRGGSAPVVIDSTGIATGNAALHRPVLRILYVWHLTHHGVLWDQTSASNQQQQATTPNQRAATNLIHIHRGLVLLDGHGRRIRRLAFPLGLPLGRCALKERTNETVDER
jgi:hypothetical protein